MARPPEITSRVVAILASRAGLRYVTPVTSVPSRTRDVSPGSAARTDQPSSIGSVYRPDALDLVQVIHDRDEAEPGVLGGPRLFDDAVEELLRRGVGEGVVGQVQAEPGAHRSSDHLVDPDDTPDRPRPTMPPMRDVPPLPAAIAGLAVPQDDVSAATWAWAHRSLPEYLLTHSVRAYCWGAAIGAGEGLPYDPRSCGPRR